MDMVSPTLPEDPVNVGLGRLHPAPTHASASRASAQGSQIHQGLIQFGHIRSRLGGPGAPLDVMGSQESQEMVSIQGSQYDTALETLLNEIGKLRPCDERGKGTCGLGMSGGQNGEADGIHRSRASSGGAHHPRTVQKKPQATPLPFHDLTDRAPNSGVGLPPSPGVAAFMGGMSHVTRAIPAPLAAATVRSIRSRMVRARFRRSFRGSQAM